MFALNAPASGLYFHEDQGPALQRYQVDLGKP
jgi:hypothetical protein